MAGFSTAEIDEARAAGLEQSWPELWADGPVRLERVDIGCGDATFQVTLDVLEVPRVYGCRCSAED